MGYLGKRDHLNKSLLTEYGIHNENSDLRVHVCPRARCVYIFPTQSGIEALRNGIETLGYQKDVDGPTANGFCVKPFDIKKCLCLRVTDLAWQAVGFSHDDSTVEKGRKATRLIKQMIINGLLNLPIECVANDSLSKRIEIKGTDIYVWTVSKKHRVHIQVKCDFPGGEKIFGGTGFLYLQTSERNPLKKF